MHTSTEIVSKKEINVISPFTHRLALVRPADLRGGHSHAAPLCIEDISPISYDHFFRHFSHKKEVRH